ncbi:DNA polymerase-3 subunit beta [Agrobacterium vitis]|nr:DNA polymerase-3 subunit beta [Agrobacterium vitis]
MITASKSTLIAALQLSKDIVERRNTIPILANLGFEEGPNGLQIRATDLDMEGIVECKADLATDFRPFTVPAGLLLEIVKKLPDGVDVKIKLKDAYGPAEVSSGRSRFTLQVLPINDLPSISAFERSTPQRCTVSAAALKAAISAVSFAISTEETRYYLNGIYMHAGADGALLVATDGHRLSKRWVSIDGEAPGGIIVPRKTVGVLEKHLPKDGDVTVEADDSKIAITMPGMKLISKLIDGTFPAYERVIPQAGAEIAEFEGKTIQSAINRVMTVCGEKSRGVKLAFGDSQLRMSVNNPDAGSSEETIAFDGPLTIESGFNGKYLLEAIDSLPEGTLTFAMADAGSPAILRADGDHQENLIVLMPMRI